MLHSCRELQVEPTGTERALHLECSQESRSTPGAVERWDVIDDCCLLWRNAAICIQMLRRSSPSREESRCCLFSRLNETPGRLNNVENPPSQLCLHISLLQPEWKRQIGNREPGNRLWQRCVSEVRATLAQRWARGWEIQSGCKSGMQNNEETKSESFRLFDHPRTSASPEFVRGERRLHRGGFCVFAFWRRWSCRAVRQRTTRLTDVGMEMAVFGRSHVWKLGTGCHLLERLRIPRLLGNHIVKVVGWACFVYQARLALLA